MLRVGLKQVRNHWGHSQGHCGEVTGEFDTDRHTKSPLGDLASHFSLSGNTFYFSDKQETTGFD